ncbi:hypothetical protein P4E94_03450 [Pontiellaceae bacterium B12219]|nr:hypothetical protein [Pontiellaceae bacterium B12219]
MSKNRGVLSSVLVLLSTIFSEAGGFEREIKIYWDGYSVPIVNSDGEPCGRVMFEFGRFKYNFFTLMGSPCQVFHFNHALRAVELDLPEAEKKIRIRPTETGTATYEPNNIWNSYADLWLPKKDFAKLKVMDFDFELNFFMGLEQPSFQEGFPGYIVGQNRGSFDVPAAKNWNEWVLNRAHDFQVFSESEYFDEKKAKAIFKALEVQHKKNVFAIAPELKLKNLEVNSYELSSILAKYDLAHVLYRDDAERSKFAPLIARFAQGAESPEAQVKAYESMKALAGRVKASPEFSQMIEQLNRSWFNDYISKKAPLNFSGDSYNEPEKMNQLLDYYRTKHAEWLPYSDLSFDFNVAMPVTFTITAECIPGDPPYYQPPLRLLSTQSFNALPASEKRRIREKQDKQDRQKWRMNVYDPWKRRFDAEQAGISSTHIEKQSEQLYANLGFEQTVSREEIIEALNQMYADPIKDAIEELNLGTFEYHQWKIETKWNLPDEQK